MEKGTRVVTRLTARGRTHVQAVNEDGRPFHVGFEKKSPRNDRLTDEQINEIWEEERKKGRAS